MVKEEEIITEAGGRGYMDMLGLGDEPDYYLCLSPSSNLSSSAVSTTTTGATPNAASPTCASYLAPPPPYHHILSFSGQEQYHGDLFGFQYYGGDQAIPVVVPQKSSPTTDCSSSISSMSSSPTATAISAISSSKPQAFKRKTASATVTNKRPRSCSTGQKTFLWWYVRRERLGERIIALQQLVSPFGKSDTASVLHEALGYIRFLHDQVQVLSSPYMQRLPPSARVPVQESADGVVVEPQQSDLRRRGLCLVPTACTDHVAGNGNGDGSDMWSTAAGMARATAAAEESKDAAAFPRGDLPGQLA